MHALQGAANHDQTFIAVWLSGTVMRQSTDTGLHRQVSRIICAQVAIDNEVLAAMSNINYAQPGGMLDTWMEGVKRCGVKNAMVIALDAMTKANAERFGIPSFEMHVQVRSTKGASPVIAKWVSIVSHGVVRR